MSKAFEFAAVRCGFVIANPDVIGILHKIIAPYPVLAPVEQIALQALSAEGIKRIQEKAVRINKNKELLTSNLIKYR